jgi:lipoprotein-releasing system ATP-binding protein
MSNPVLSLRGLVRTYTTGQRRPDGAQGRRSGRPSGRDRRPDRAVGLGQVVPAARRRPAGAPDRGQVIIDGEDVGQLDERARTRIRLNRIGFVYQFHHLLPEFDARDNVALPIRIAGRSEAEARKMAEAALGSLGLAERVLHQPAQMSGGEQQRVAARPGAGQQAAPAAGRRADRQPRPRHQPDGVRGPARSGQDTGVAALIATHNMELAGHMDRVFALKDGHLEERPAESQTY